MKNIYIVIGLMATISSKSLEDTPTQIPANMKPCSNFICEGSDAENTDCKVWDQCYCDGIFMICPKIALQEIYVVHNTVQKRLFLGGVKSGRRFQDVIGILTDLIQPLYLEILTITNFNAMTPIEYSNIFLGDMCSLERNDILNYTSVFNVSTFPPRDDVWNLNLGDNGFEILSGNFSAAFKNLKHLTLDGNFLTRIEYELFKDLHNLETLSLTMNRLSTIERGNFQGLSKLQNLHLSINCISELREDTFWDLLYLETLSIDSNQLKSLHENIFTNKTSLKVLSLNRNQLISLPNKIFEKLTELTTLALHSNNLTSLPQDLFRNNKMLQTVYLYNNKLFQLSENLFRYNFYLTEAHLGGNSFNELPSINHINLNNISASAAFFLVQINISHVPFLPSKIKASSLVDISSNCIKTFDDNLQLDLIVNPVITKVTCRNCCLSYIPYYVVLPVKDEVDLSENSIMTLTNLDMSIASSIAKVDLTYNALERIFLNWSYPIIQNSSRYVSNPKTRYVLNFNPIICDCQLFPFLQFINRDSSALAEGEKFSDIRFEIDNLYCSSPALFKDTAVKSINHKRFFCEVNSESECPKNCDCHFQPYVNFKYVNCSQRNMKEFPHLKLSENLLALLLHNNKISSLPSDKDLWSKVHAASLSNNALTSVKNISIFPSLLLLGLDNNQLTEIEPPIIEFLKANSSKRFVSLSENPLKCNCHLLNIKSLLYVNTDISNISCLLSNGSKIFIANASDAILCPAEYHLGENNKLLIIALIVIVAFLVICSIVFFILLKYPSEVKLWLFSHKLCLKFVIDKDIDLKKRYDAFVSYSAKDEVWVAKVLVPGLEQGKPTYRLCLHERDWLPGEWIPEQIICSVQQSLRTIIVLTQHFIASDWSRLEFLTAYQQTVNDKNHKLIVIIPNDMPNIDKLEQELQNFIVNNTYLKWNDPYFWRKLKCAMPRRYNCPETQSVTHC